MRAASEATGSFGTVLPEGPARRSATTLTPLVVERWFGTKSPPPDRSSRASPGVAAERPRTGPPVQEASDWVKSEFEQGRPLTIMSLFGKGKEAGAVDPIARENVANRSWDTSTGSANKGPWDVLFRRTTPTSWTRRR